MLIGVNTHFDYDNTAYGQNPAGAVAAIRSMNFNVIRENSAKGVAYLKQNGFVNVIGVAGNGTVAKAMLEAGADYLEGPNELFTKTSLGSQSYRANLLKDTWKAVAVARDNFQAATSKWIPLLAPSASLGNYNDALAVAKLIGPLTYPADFTSIHCYPGNRTPAQYEAHIDRAIALAAILSPNTPHIVTEFGTWWDDDAAIRNAATHTPTAPSDAVTLWPRYFDILKVRDIKAAVVYELTDEAGKALQEGRLGITGVNYSDKPWTSVVRDYAKAENFPPPPTPQPVTTNWAVPITPDPTDRIKALQVEASVTADGILGNQTLTAIESLVQNRRDVLQANTQLLVDNDALKHKIATARTQAEEVVNTLAS